MAYLFHLVARFLLTAGFRRLRLQSPPSPSSSGPVDLAHAAWSTPASLVGVSALAQRCLRCPPCHRVGWMAAATPTSPPCCARPLGREHDAAPLAVAALGRWPCCRNRGCAVVSPPWSSTLLLCEHSCEFLLPSLLLCACYGGLASEPGMLAYAVAVPCCYCCSAEACATAAVVLLLWVPVQVLVQDSVKNFLTELGMII
jgi:hypothetical protein